MLKDPYHAFLPYPEAPPRAGTGALSGSSFAVKDLFDVEGYPTGFGQPHVLARSGIQPKSARMVEDLLKAGAEFRGKTHLVEMAFALTGRNVHFGTPVNPRAKDRLPGGSSSGSASAVAGGLADIGLASDTLGSIRVPASYCGLYGIRPTHGRLSLAGARPLAPSLDTGGWLTRDATTLTLLAENFLPDAAPTNSKPPRFRVPKTLMSHLEPGVEVAFEGFIQKIRQNIGEVEPLFLDPETVTLWVDTVRIIQGYEAWKAHGEMIESDRPELGPGIRERFAFAASISPADYKKALNTRKHLAGLCHAELEDVVLVLPSAPGPAPLREASDDDLEVHRTALLRQLALASLFGRPEVSLPVINVDKLPVGVSLIGSPHQDLALVRLAEALAAL